MQRKIFGRTWAIPGGSRAQVFHFPSGKGGSNRVILLICIIRFTNRPISCVFLFLAKTV
jgi:hypothetical protein